MMQSWQNTRRTDGEEAPVAADGRRAARGLRRDATFDEEVRTAMTSLQYQKAERIWLKDHPELNERWLQDRIAEDPSLLGLGELILKDKERPQPRAGRLDLLFQAVDEHKRYEVEIQLGKTDESHIIRTIEYWDIERKRYPQYDHTAVLVAEDITSRFLNVVGLFNGFIPLVALELNALRLGDSIILVFTKVLDETRLGLVDEDEEIQAVADRSYWEARASKQTLALMDEVLELVREIDPGLEPKYNKFYVGLAKGGQPNNFVIFRPKKQWLDVEIRLERSEETQAKLDGSDLDVIGYDSRSGRYRIRLAKGDPAKHKDTLRDLFTEAYKDTA
jgi:predicted transport protein